MTWPLAARMYPWRRMLYLGIGSVVIAAGIGWLCWRAPGMSACEKAVRTGNHRSAVEICLASHQQTRSDGDLRWAAKAHLYLGEIDPAEALAERFRPGPLWGDAHAILSFVALRRERPGLALGHAVLAYIAHILDGDELGQASDALLVSQIAWRLGDLATALSAADSALALAVKLKEPRREVAAQFARGEALCVLADRPGAIEALTAAVDRAATRCDIAWARLKLGRCEILTGQPGVGMHHLDEAAEANRECGAPDITNAVYALQAWQLRSPDPTRALFLLDRLAADHGDDLDSLILRGMIAADRGALADAERYFAQAADFDPPSVNWAWEIPRFRGELAELRGGPLADVVAENYYRSSTALVGALRPAARAHSAFVVSAHRGSYDNLIALYARNRRWRDALSVVLDLDASDMLRATAGQNDLPSALSVAPALFANPAAAPPALVDDVLAAWRTRDLVIVVAPSPRRIGRGGERVIRIRVVDGQVTGEEVGDSGAAMKWADALFADLGDRDAARALAQLMIPPGPGDGRPLYVLTIGALGKVPLAALRDQDGALAIARRPIIRVLALRATNPESRATGPAVVIADPTGDLDGARAEGPMVAAAVGAARVFGATPPLHATRDRLWAASDAGLLHVAAHVRARGWWRALQLADGEVEPAEIVRRRFAPRTAVLASCGSAAAMDEEGWGSIAAALLEAGTSTVIATDRVIRDADGQAVMTAFYAQPDWRSDPARALARVQQAFDARASSADARRSEGSIWAAFLVLGRPPETPATVPPSH
jgi:tetratricopeptide (TPR) repeat protein